MFYILLYLSEYLEFYVKHGVTDIQKCDILGKVEVMIIVDTKKLKCCSWHDFTKIMRVNSSYCDLADSASLADSGIFGIDAISNEILWLSQ